MNTASDSAEVLGSADMGNVERCVRETASAYGTSDEVALAIENTKLMSGIAESASERALCLMHLIALHDRRRVLAQ